MKRVNINFDEDLLSKIDAYAKTMGVSRSAAICFLCANQLLQNQTITTLGDVINVINDKDNR